MAANSRILTKTLGVNTGSPSKLTLKLVFTESAVNAAAGTSAIKCVVTLTNANDNIERRYQHGNGLININVVVAGKTYTKSLSKGVIDFDLKGGKTKTLGTLQWNGLPHALLTATVSATYSWPTGTGGAATGSAGSGALTLSTGIKSPTAPTWATANAVTPGAGTSTVLNWVNHDAAFPNGQYDNLVVQVEQADYPDHFVPGLLLTDVSNVAGGTLPLSNYSIQTFWFTALGAGTKPGLASSPVTFANVPANKQIVVKAPTNPPKQATGWGIAVSRANSPGGILGTPIIQAFPGAPASSATMGSRNASGVMPSWKSPVKGPTPTGDPAPVSIATAATNFAWSALQSYTLAGTPNTPATYTVPTIGGFWYKFTLRAINSAPGMAETAPQIYYAPGSAPNTGGNTTGDGEGGTNVAYAPQGEIPFYGQAFNYVNASCSVISVPPQSLNFATPAASLTAGSDLSVVNYCSDPRGYWLSASTAGNNTASPFVAEVSAAGYTSHNAQTPPQQMLYALQALGLASVDRGHTQTFVASNNNTGAQVQHYVFIGGNPDSANTAASLPVPAGGTTMQVSAMAWVNSANNATGRTVTPYTSIRFSSVYANGTVIGSPTTVALSAQSVNTLKQLSASYTLPAGAAAVSAALVANTAAGANWTGGYQAGDSITVTGFMVLFDQQPTTPYFDGGWPVQPNFRIVNGGDIAIAPLTAITTTRDANTTGTSLNQPDIGSWPPQVRAPLATYPDAYPYAGWAQEWYGTAAQQDGYGGTSGITAPAYAQYAKPSGDTALVWHDQNAPSGSFNVMAFDSTAAAVIAGNSTLAGFSGGLVNLLKNVPFSVTTTAYCPGWSSALGNLARYRLVIAGGSSSGTTYSPAIQGNGPLTWTFTVPLDATGAYLAVENMAGDPEDVVRFTKPTFRAVMAANTAALGYLGSANAVPLRMAQIQMPSYYRKNGWPTPAKYLLKDASALTFISSTLPGTVGAPVLMDPRAVALASNQRFLASQGYSQAAGTWTPWKDDGLHSLTMHGGTAPYYASADDNNAYAYNLAGQLVTIPSLQFDAALGTWLYSDDFNTAGNITGYTILLVLSLNNSYLGSTGIWSAVPVAGGGGPDTGADLTGFNYRAVRSTGANLEVSSPGMSDTSVQIGQSVRLQKPTYLALTFNNYNNTVNYADDPASMLTATMGLANQSGAGPLLGSIVLGADATDGLSSSSFSLFEMNVYYGTQTIAAIRREIALLGQIYG